MNIAMKRILLGLSLLSALAVPAFAATTPKAHVQSAHKPQSKRAVTAPADEYFGHQKFSILGIRNALHDLNIRYDGTAARTTFLYANAAGLEDAMHDWDRKYHGDLWLAHYLFQLDQIYMRVPSELGHDKVTSTSLWIIGVYPNTYYGKYLKHIRSLHPAVAKATPAASATGSPTVIDAPSAPPTSPALLMSPSPSPSTPPVMMHTR